MVRHALIKTDIEFLTIRERSDSLSPSKGFILKFAKGSSGQNVGLERLDVLTGNPILNNGYRWVEIKNDQRQQGWVPSEHLAYEAQSHNTNASAATIYSNPFSKTSAGSLANGQKVFVLNYYLSTKGLVEVAKLKGLKLEPLGWVEVDDLKID